MAGIYIHIPFCKSRCTYCGFFSTTTLHLQEAYIEALCHELIQRQDYLKDEPIETIYFGGGTPSLLPTNAIRKVLSTIYNIYKVRAREVTMECNPDDIANTTSGQAQKKLSELHTIGINRLSIGIQTFNDNILKMLNRRHTAQQAIEAATIAHATGFDNISVDLMFGLPTQTLIDLHTDLHKAMSLDIQHISVYSLTYEENTSLYHQLLNGNIEEADEELSRSMYEHILNTTAQHGFKHYEISNFAISGKESIHNSNYWNGTPYIGIGAGAHSFNGESRQYNTESLTTYIKGTANGQTPFTKEILTQADKYNEFVFTALRTHKGLDLKKLQQLFGNELHDYCLRMAQKHINSNTLTMHPQIETSPNTTQNNTLSLTRSGLFISNDIMSDLMFLPD